MSKKPNIIAEVNCNSDEILVEILEEFRCHQENLINKERLEFLVHMYIQNFRSEFFKNSEHC